MLLYPWLNKCMGYTSVRKYCPLVSSTKLIHTILQSTRPRMIPRTVTVFGAGGRFKNSYELLNLRALKFSMLFISYIFQYIGKIFCVEFQRVPLKFRTKYHTNTLKDADFIHEWKLRSSKIEELISVFEHHQSPPPRSIIRTHSLLLESVKTTSM